MEQVYDGLSTHQVKLYKINSLRFCRVQRRIIHKNTGKCLQPENLPPLEAGKRRTLLAPIQTGNQSQLWCFTPVANRQGWYFIENHMKENDDEGKRCLDVCCRSEETGTSVITYHKKQVRPQTIGNQWWMIEYMPSGSDSVDFLIK